jgi:hypothetical protein
MRRLAILSLITLAAAVPLHAAKGQSYFTYDDGGTIIRQGDDGREIDARVNVPVFPSDEVITSRRGRSEIRLSDGNVIALDRSTDIRFKSILDSYDGEGSQTIVELKYGHIIVQRTDSGREYLRVDTDSASYVAADESVYAVDSDRGTDRVVVFDGAVEVRTPNRTQRVRAGEEAKVDGEGVYGLVSDSHYGADDFERWYLRRAERYGHGSSRYLDRSLAYADYDLSQHGSWVYVNGFNTWCWRPNVAVGWRPYYNGEWGFGRSGGLIWISYEPWGWVPYHYGRWSYDPFYGWVWLPGTGYSPAWVYWMYGPNYVGWAPAGWWDCYRPYYEWCYRPYASYNFDLAYLFFGHTRVTDIDLRPWTFLQPGQLVSSRVDRAAFSTDIVRERVLRGGGGDAVVISNNPARFTRNDLRDPAGAINNIVRRSHESPGTSTDVTQFIRRDPEISTGIRDRIVRTAPPSGGGNVSSGGGLAPIRGGGGLAPIGGGSVAPIGGGLPAPIVPSTDGRVRRGDNGNTGSSTPSRGTTGGDRGSSGSNGRVRRNDDTTWRDTSGGSGAVRRDEPAATVPGIVNRGGEPITTTPQPGAPVRDDWRQRAVRPGDNAPVPRATTPAETPRDRGARDIPRRIIDSIGGARVTPGDSGHSRDTSGSSGSSGSRDSSGSSGSRDSSGSHDSGRTHESSPPPQQQERSSPPPPPPPSHDSGNNGGGGRGDSGHVNRDKP